eukprot:6218117-Pyramimonas_sp.AAC.1
MSMFKDDTGKEKAGSSGSSTSVGPTAGPSPRVHTEFRYEHVGQCGTHYADGAGPSPRAHKQF